MLCKKEQEVILDQVLQLQTTKMSQDGEKVV